MLKVQELSYTASQGSGTTLSQLNFHIPSGEIFGILGPKGSGKATLQNILIGLYRVYSGTVHFQGKELNDWSRDFYESIGTVLPNRTSTHFPKLTATENLAYFGSLYRGQLESIPTLLETMGLKEAAQTCVSLFSASMLARLSIARAILHKPSMLFLYEPLIALEPNFAESLKGLIKLQKSLGRTVVIFTQDQALANVLCDRIAHFEQGKIVEFRIPRHRG
jgi:fluoroquinolone transport system ATP-binding protein